MGPTPGRADSDAGNAAAGVGSRHAAAPQATSSASASSAAATAAPLLVEAQAAVQAAASAAGDASERLREALAERDSLQSELRAMQRRLEVAPLARRDERLLAQLKVGGARLCACGVAA